MRHTHIKDTHLVVCLEPPKLSAELVVVVGVVQALIGLQYLADEVHELLEVGPSVRLLRKKGPSDTGQKNDRLHRLWGIRVTGGGPAGGGKRKNATTAVKYPKGRGRRSMGVVAVGIILLLLLYQHKRRRRPAGQRTDIRFNLLCSNFTPSTYFPRVHIYTHMPSVVRTLRIMYDIIGMAYGTRPA